jgi:hypothetical protein
VYYALVNLLCNVLVCDIYFQRSFVLEPLATPAVVAEVDSADGYGRVKEAPHWMAAKGAYWRRPEGSVCS